MSEPLDPDVRVCQGDNTPLVFTMEFPGFELHCMTCGGHEGVFGRRVGNTPEIELLQGELTERYDAERAERRGEPAPPTRPHAGDAELALPVCGGCGRSPADGTPLDGQMKPPVWFSRTRDGVTQYACSTACTDGAPRHPW